MKNIILSAYGTGIGGMEVLFTGLVKYLLSQNYKVFIITIDNEKNIYKQLLKKEWHLLHIVYRPSDNIMYMSEDERNNQRVLVLKQIGKSDIEGSFGVCGFYRDLLILMDVFNGYDLKITFIWPHPLDWVNYIPLKQNEYYIKKNIYSRHYQFQKRLFNDLDNHNASYYTSYAIYDFNCWYYNSNLGTKHIEGLPVQNNAGLSFNYVAKEKINTINILWVGRFDFYKVDAIEYIFNSLEALALDYASISIIFNIAGHGAKQYEDRLKKSIQPENIKVNFLGTIAPSSLNEEFAKNDIGIAMGVTVKQMGMAGLPAILIDSMSDDYKGGQCCNWLFDIATGDDGDGIYYHYSNRPLSCRKDLKELLVKVIDTPLLLDSYSRKCKEYVGKYYSHDRQYSIIENRIINSTFSSKGRETYRYGFFRRILRVVVKMVH